MPSLQSPFGSVYPNVRYFGSKIPNYPYEDNCKTAILHPRFSISGNFRIICSGIYTTEPYGQGLFTAVQDLAKLDGQEEPDLRAQVTGV